MHRMYNLNMQPGDLICIKCYDGIMFGIFVKRSDSMYEFVYELITADGLGYFDASVRGLVISSFSETLQ